MSAEYRDYIRIKRGNRKLVLQVLVVEWSGPHEPVSHWKTVKTLEPSVSLSQLDDEVAGLLKDPSHFGFCTQCNDHFVNGHMHGEEYCQSCAEQYLGICH